MNGQQFNELYEYLRPACGHTHIELEMFLALKFGETKFKVNRHDKFDTVVFEFLQNLQQKDGLEPRFALALLSHFPNATELVVVARDILLADPLIRLAQTLELAADPVALARCAAECFDNLRPRYDTGEAEQSPAGYAVRLAQQEDRKAAVKFATLFQYVWRVRQETTALGPAAASALDRWLRETAERLTRTVAECEALLAAARQVGGTGRPPLRHIVVQVIPTKDADRYLVHAWVMAEDGGGAVRLTEEPAPIGADAVVAENPGVRAETVALDHIRQLASRYLYPDDPDVWYEFILPPELIGRPVDECWLLDDLGLHRNRRLGTHQVVVVRSNLPHSNMGGKALAKLKSRWAPSRFTVGANCVVRQDPTECDGAAAEACLVPGPLASNLIQELEAKNVHCCVVGIPYQPNFAIPADLLYTILGAGVPVAVWGRTAAATPAVFAGRGLYDLPHHIRTCRAGGGCDMALFWEDPRRGPPEKFR